MAQSCREGADSPLTSADRQTNGEFVMTRIPHSQQSSANPSGYASPQQAGEPSAISADSALRLVYRKHMPFLVGYLTRFLNGDRDRAEDVIQETFIRAWRHPEVRNAEGVWNWPWLFTVARNIAVDHIRASHARPRELPDEWIEATAQSEDDVDRLIDVWGVRAAVAELPVRLRTVLVLVYFQGFSVAEAAGVLGVPPGTVKSRTYYAIRALRDVFRARGFDLGTPPTTGPESPSADD
jgi:RNA polymerase sigma-70 factor (ECF subfamily)